MIKLLLTFLLVGMSHAFCQRSSSDPEMLFFLSDSLNYVDTAKLESKREFLQSRYINEISLYHFDKQEQHLLHGIRCCDQMAEEDHFSSVKPLIQGMWCGHFLANTEVIGKFYRLLVDHKLEAKLNEYERYEVDRYVKMYHLNSYSGTKLIGKVPEFDTTVTILFNKRLAINDLQNQKTEFSGGDSTYLDIRIVEAKRKNPKCIRKLTVLLPGPEIPQVMVLADANCIFSPKSVAFDSKPVRISGKLVHNEFGLYILIEETELPKQNMSATNCFWISPQKLNQ